MATIRSLLGIVCVIVCGGFVKPSSDFLIKAEGGKVESLVAMLYFDQKSLSIAKNDRQSSVPVESKKQQYNRAISTSKPQTQWFCVNAFTAFNFSVANKTKCQCFFDAGRFVKRHLRVIDKHFCILLMLQKFDALRHRANDKLNANNSSYIEGKELIANSINRLIRNRQLTSSAVNQLQTKDSELRTKTLAIARSQLGIREATGKNDGVAVEAYLSYTGNTKGTPWCASFVSWVYGKAGLAKPKTPWSPALFPLAKQTLNPLPADVFGIYFPSLKRVAHCGLVEASRGNWLQTIEGNTNADGLREGNGVYRKLRHKRTIAVYANWLKSLKKGGDE